MANKAKFQAVKGTRDLLPPETQLWNRVEQTAHEVFATFGFSEIRPPIFEPTELLARAVGGETDIVSKEMYTFEDRAGGLPDPGEMSPDGFLNEIKRAMNSGQLANDAAVIAQLEFQLENYNLRSDPERARLIWMYFVRGLRLGDSISLRPEATASVCRAYIEHNMQQLPQPVKLYYMGPMFRRERPQKGRYRQFYQIGAEVLGGGDAPALAAEVIEMLMTYFDKCGLQGSTLYINSIGHNADNCRRGYVANLKSALEKVKDKLGFDSLRRIDTNPLRVLDSKLESEQVVIAALPHIADHLCDQCKTHYAEVKRQLEVRGVLYQENWRLVRGLDYYMRTTFEITAPGLGSQNAVCGGGRYDGLVELLGGPPTRGIGFAIGTDRLMLSLEAADEQSGEKAPASGIEVFLAWFGA